MKVAVPAIRLGSVDDARLLCPRVCITVINVVVLHASIFPARAGTSGVSRESYNIIIITYKENLKGRIRRAARSMSAVIANRAHVSFKETLAE